MPNSIPVSLRIRELELEIKIIQQLHELVFTRLEWAGDIIEWFSHSVIIIYTLRVYFIVLFILKAWMQNKVPIPAPNEVLNDRKEDIKLEEKKKTQAEIEQEMATLQYTNPQLLEVRDTFEGIQDDLRK